MITTGPNNPPEVAMDDRIEQDRQQLLQLITTLQQSYSSVGVLAWLLSKNANLHRQSPIQVWLDGERQSVLDVADQIEGGS